MGLKEIALWTSVIGGTMFGLNTCHNARIEGEVLEINNYEERWNEECLSYAIKTEDGELVRYTYTSSRDDPVFDHIKELIKKGDTISVPKYFSFRNTSKRPRKK